MENSNFNNLNYYDNNNNDQNNNDRIRPPDNIIRERIVNDYYNDDILIPCDNDEYDNAFQLACIQSIREQEELFGITNLRTQSFKNVLLKIKKISMIDPEILEFYNMIESIIAEYCSCRINSYECDINMYNSIFNTLKTIRITETELELFKNLFNFIN
jgi:hypothetical protein